VLENLIDMFRPFQCRASRAGRSDVVAPGRRVDALLDDLAMVARTIGPITHEFADDNRQPTGYVQLHRKGASITIHRIWALRPHHGFGSQMLRQLCSLADRHGVELRLKVAPLGAKPYPLSSDQLRGWYQRHGFHGTNKLIRQPAVRRASVCS
jgi:hypothetical protein